MAPLRRSSDRLCGEKHGRHVIEGDHKDYIQPLSLADGQT